MAMMSERAGATASEISAQLEGALQTSIEQYRAVLQHMNDVSDALSASATNLMNLVQKLRERQLAAQQGDEELLELLSQCDKSVVNHPLFLQRSELIEQILQLNRLLLPNIDGMMAVVSHELAQVRNGRVVLGGYKQASQKHGRIIKSSV